MRKAREKVFHLKCFTCFVCRKQLVTGEELYVVDDTKFVCKEDYNHRLNGECWPRPPPAFPYNQNNWLGMLSAGSCEMRKIINSIRQILSMRMRMSWRRRTAWRVRRVTWSWGASWAGMGGRDTGEEYSNHEFTSLQDTHTLLS